MLLCGREGCSTLATSRSGFRRLKGAALGILAMAATTGGAAVAGTKAVEPAGMAAYGFPRVVAAAFVAHGALALRRGIVSIEVPVGALPVGSRVELLEGPVASWQRLAPRGQRIVADFALRVLSSRGALITSFASPVKAVIRSGRVGAGTLYENTTPTRLPKIVPNPVMPSISGHTLAHPLKADGVGWVIADRVSVRVK